LIFNAPLNPIPDTRATRAGIWIGFWIILAVILPLRPARCAAWDSGVGVGGFGSAGNLALAQPGLEWDLFVRRFDGGNGYWTCAVSGFDPSLSGSQGIHSARLTSLWIWRGARFRFLTRWIELEAGPGWARWVNDAGGRRVILGTPTFSAGGGIHLWTGEWMTLTGAVSFRSAHLPETIYVTDRMLFILRCSLRLWRPPVVHETS
jgi:hypothetical protein